MDNTIPNGLPQQTRASTILPVLTTTNAYSLITNGTKVKLTFCKQADAPTVEDALEKILTRRA